MRQLNNSIQDTVRMLVDKGMTVDEAIEEIKNKAHCPLLDKYMIDQLRESILYEVRK